MSRALGTLLIALVLGASPGIAAPIDLGGGTSLEIGSDSITGAATVTLSTNGSLQEAVTIGNASALSPAQKIRFCAKCAPVYFLALDDKTSTYGASTGVVVWSSGPAPWWQLSILPLDRPTLGGPDKRGLRWLKDGGNGKAYTFAGGFLTPR